MRTVNSRSRTTASTTTEQDMPPALGKSEPFRIVYHPDYLTHYYTSTAESPVRIKAIHNKLGRLYRSVTPEPATEEDILRVHDRRLFLDARNQGEPLFRTALLAAGGAIAAARLSLKNIKSFAIVRPPGHHAGPNRNGRFCFFNNMGVAVARLRARHSIGAVAIVDIDMHQGDGTQAIFAEDSNTYIIDLWARDRKTYLEMLEADLRDLPAVDMIGVSAGFDWSIYDWGRLLDTDDFHAIGRLIGQTAEEKAGGRCFAILEGGYAVNTLGRAVLAFCRGLQGLPG